MMKAQLDHPLSIDPQDTRSDVRMSPFHLAERLWALRWPLAAISHHAKIILFPVPKAADTALLATLTEVEQRAGLEPRFTDPRTGEPSHLEWIRPRGRAAWSGVFAFNRGYSKIAVVRNPWQRLVACYLDNEVDDAMPFAEFVRAVCRTPDFAADLHIRSQWRQFHTPRGDLLADQLIPVEEGEALRALFAHHGVEFRPVWQTVKDAWEQFYTPELAAKVRKRYWRDVLMLGYGAGWWQDPTDRRRG